MYVTAIDRRIHKYGISVMLTFPKSHTEIINLVFLKTYFVASKLNLFAKKGPIHQVKLKHFESFNFS